MKTLIDYYDDNAQMWADRWYSNETLLPYLKKFFAYLNSNPKVLDLCCGAGYESMRMKKLGAEVTGLDLSKNSIYIAKEKNPNINFYVKDMLKSYADLGEFDGIACIAGLVHLEENDLDTAFKNMHEVLKVQGMLFVVVKDGNKVTKSVNINGIEYERKFFCYTLSVLKKHAKKYFDFVEEFKSEDDWKYYIFRKKDAD